MTRHTDLLQILTIVACAARKDVLEGDSWWDYTKQAEKRGWVVANVENIDSSEGLRRLNRSGEVWTGSGKRVMSVKLTARGRRVYEFYEIFGKEVRNLK